MARDPTTGHRAAGVGREQQEQILNEEATDVGLSRPVVQLETEAEISADLVSELTRLGPERCVFRPEVRMLCWTHATRSKADVLRIDFVAELEGRLIGIEVKKPPEHSSDLGRYLLQSAQYAAGVIAANVADVPQHWIGKPLVAVFLRTKLTGAHERLRDHAATAPRLFGPANVGFVTKERRGLCLRLCAERFWTEWSGYHKVC